MKYKQLIQPLFILFTFCLILLFPQKTFATTVSDNFNRSNGGLGSNWTTMTGTSAPQIVSNTVEPGVSGAENVAYWTANTFGASQFVQATMPSVSGTEDGPGIGVRFANSRGYFLWFNHASNTVTIYRMDAVNNTNALATSSTLTVSNTDVWKLAVIGTTLVGFQNGLQVVEANDSTYTSGSPGVWLFNASNQITNWSGGDMPVQYSLGGTVSGISGKAVLHNSDGTTLNVTNNGNFAFNSPYTSGTSYTVTVQTNPTSQICTVSNGSGTISSSNITNISISCSGNPLATSATDNFNRSDGSLGSNWTDGSEGGLQISSQQVIGTNAGGTTEDFRSAETYSGNQYSQIEVGTVSGDQFIGPAVRMQNNGQDCYLGLYDYNNGSPFLQIFKRNGGSFSQLTGQLSISALSSGTTLKLMVVGDTIAFLVNGVEKQSVYDNSITGGAPGIMAFRTPTADNWSGGNAGFEVHYLSSSSGIDSYDVISANNGHGPTTLRVLNPTSPAAGVPHNFLFVLPVEQIGSNTFGDALTYLQSLDAQNQYNLTIVEPSFFYDPWYADNPSDPDQQYETFMAAELEPWVTQNLATTGTEQNWLIGFSKSGNGGQDLIFKHPDVFTLVASWDSPFSMFSDARFSPSSSQQYGTDTNFMNNYELSLAFLQAHGSPFQSAKRIWIGGFQLYTQDDSDYDLLLTSLGIQHLTEIPTSMTHNWTSGWVPLALAGLAQNGTNLLTTPTPTPISSSNSSGNTNSSTSNSSNTPSNPNAHQFWKYVVDAGPDYVGIAHYISNASIGQNAMALIANDATPIDISLTIERLVGDALIQQLSTNPFPWMQGLNTVSDIYHFISVSAFNGYPVDHFSKPIIIILSYNPTKLFGIDPHQLRLARYNMATHRWVVLENNTVLDVAHHTVANTTTELTYFAVVYHAKNRSSGVKVLGASVSNQKADEKEMPIKLSPTPYKMNMPAEKKIDSKKTCLLWMCW